MNVRLITQEEISSRQQHLRTTYLQSQKSFTSAGFRQLIGNTFIAMGHKIHGRCEQRRTQLANATPLKTARGI